MSSATAEPISSSSSNSNFHDLRDYPQEALNRVALPFPTLPFISCHVLISSATIIEFPATSSLNFYFILFFATSLFRALGVVYFVINFWFKLSGSICLFGFVSLGLNSCDRIVSHPPLSSSCIDIPSLVVFMRYLNLYIGS